jgi:hypothetical protein
MMKNALNVLVAEDHFPHVTDLMLNVNPSLSALPLSIGMVIAPDLEAALNTLNLMDAVMTDDRFPAEGDDRGLCEPNGQRLVERCLAMGKPVVMVSANRRYASPEHRAMRHWCHERGVGMFDSPGMDGEADRKPWKEALYSLVYLMISLGIGTRVITDGRILLTANGFPAAVHRAYVEPFLIPGICAETWTPDPVQRIMLEQGFTPA